MRMNKVVAAKDYAAQDLSQEQVAASVFGDSSAVVVVVEGKTLIRLEAMC